MADELTKLNQAKAEVEKELYDISTKPNDMLSKWTDLETALVAKLPNEKPKNPANRTMRQRHEQILKRLRDEPNKMLQEGQAFYQKSLAFIDKKINSFSAGGP